MMMMRMRIDIFFYFHLFLVLPVIYCRIFCLVSDFHPVDFYGVFYLLSFSFMIDFPLLLTPWFNKLL